MTVTYTAEVATCKKFGCFIKLLTRWRGSIYKLVWMDLLLFLFFYYTINLIYMHLLDIESQRTFESVVYYCANYSSLIPLSFVLGFYVNLVMARWWEQYMTIPWPDSVAVYVSAHVHGQDERGRVMRRTVMRYVCLCLTIVFTMISPCVKKRFPKMKHLVETGLLLENEKKIIETMDSAFPKYPKHWMPIVWAASIITRARKEGLIRDDFAVKTIIDELNNFRGRCGTLMYYDFICIPLVYTQVVTIAVYSFFVCSLLAHQWTEFKKDSYEGLDFYIPIFITLQFFFYMGWLKVAETLINPFGEDDDDFEVNWMIDRNLQVSYLIVDEMHHEHPELVKDQYWDEVYPDELPYESEAKREQHPEHSTAKYDVNESPLLSTVKVKAVSDTNSRDGKSNVESLISRRSESFNAAFQRFSQCSEEIISPSNLFSDHNTRDNSISDVESIQNITSYITSKSSEEFEDFKMDNTGLGRRNTLETVSEEEDVDVEEEHYWCEEEEKQFSYESDSDSDPFERLRLERQQKRTQRMYKFLQRYFGSNFKITMPNVVPEKRTVIKEKKIRTSDPGSQTFQKQVSGGAIPNSQTKWNSSKSMSKALIEKSNSLTSIDSTLNDSKTVDSNLNRILNNLPINDTFSPIHNVTGSSAYLPNIFEQIETSLPFSGTENSSIIQESNDATPSPLPLNDRPLQVDAVISIVGSLIAANSSEQDSTEDTASFHSSH